MSKHADDQIEQAERAAIPPDEVLANAIHRLSQRVVELEATTQPLLNALTRYRVQHDMRLWHQERPCTCEICRQANEAIKAAKGGA